MNSLRLRFPNREHDDRTLAPGVHAIGRDAGGRAAIDHDVDAPLAQLCIDRRGVWLQLHEGARGLHVNGRAVRRMAMLRVGDAIFVEGSELLLLGADPLPAPAASSISPGGELREDPRVVLRGVGGLHHGRSVTLDRPRLVGRLPECDLHVDEPAFADRHARLEPHRDGVVLRDLGSAEGSVVNGQRVRHALLRAGDQVVFDAHHRFVVEAPIGNDWNAVAAVEPVEPPPRPAPLPGPTTAATARRVPWLLLAALLLAAALSLLLLYGVR